MTLCQSQPDDEANEPENQSTLSRWPKSLNLKDAYERYTDHKSEKVVEVLADEFQVIHNGIDHLVHVSNQEQVRAKLLQKRKELREQLTVFRDLKQDLDEENIYQLKQEVKDRMDHTQNFDTAFDEGQLEAASDDDRCSTKQSPRMDTNEDTEQSPGLEKLERQITKRNGNKKKTKKCSHSVATSGPRAKLTRSELIRQFQDIIDKTVEILIMDHTCKEKIDQININIDEGDDNPELHLLEEMLALHYK